MVSELPTVEVTASKNASEPQSQLDTALSVHEQALAELQRCWQHALDGHCPHVSSSDKPAVDRFALVKRLLQAVGGSEPQCVRGQCVQQQTGVDTFLPIFDALAQLYRSSPRGQLVALTAQR
ncbi:MAG: hypothetical protein HC808_13980 [Candidatus Competibacteraceae bacterium]|nr:hypothetical protein [Candidatus Competibacteraceae bacterium]